MTQLAPLPTNFNMAFYVLAKARDLSKKPALEILHPDRTEVWTYAQLNHAVRCFAAGLLARGIGAGDTVLLRLGNTALFPVAYLGCIAIDALPVPVSVQLTEPEIQTIKAEIAPRLTVSDTPTTHEVAVGGISAPDPISDDQFVYGDPNRPAYIIYTSGTSGKPRAVVHAHRAIWARRMMWDGWYGLRAGDRVLHAGAFNWTYTLGTGLMDPWAIGATALIPAKGTDAACLPDLMARHRATIFAAAPGVYRRMLRHAFPMLPDLRHGLSAGETMSPTLQSKWTRTTGTAVHQAFGMSECSTFISGCPDRPAPAGAIGWIQDGRQVKLMPQTGEIAVHRSDPGMMLGYWGAQAETCARFEGDWFRTGDLGTRTDEGAISYAGRIDDMMNAGGTRVSPVEVEAALSAHPDITDVAVCAVQLDTDISLIAAFYVSADLLDHSRLDQFARAHLAAYKTPRIWVHSDTLPRGANNKLLRRKLRQDWEAAHGQA